VAEDMEWGMTRSESLNRIHTERLAKAAQSGDVMAKFQADFGAYVAEQRLRAQRPRASVELGNPCNQQSTLPTLTPEEILALEPLLPQPPLPYGYSRSNFDLTCILGQFNSANTNDMLKAIKGLARALHVRHLDAKLIDMLVQSMEQVIERLRAQLRRNVVPRRPEENEAALQDAVDYFERMVSNQRIIFQKARNKIGSYDAAKNQCLLFRK